MQDQEPIFQCKFKVNSHVSKKNSRPVHFRKANIYSRAPFIGKSHKLVLAENLMATQLAKSFFASGLKTIKGPIRVQFTFYFSNFYTKKNQKNKKLPDLSNLYELPQDAMQKASVIENDSQIESHDGSRRKPSHDGHDYIECKIYNFLENYE